MAFVLWVTSAPTALAGPDTLIGARNQNGQIFIADDDGSLLGDGFASGLYGVPTSNGVIDFVITGYTDLMFVGMHTQSGAYQVFVSVYDFFGDPVELLSETRTLLPGALDQYSFSDVDWVGGSYDVYIDNTVVPEPTGLSLLAAAALGLGLGHRGRVGVR